LATTKDNRINKEINSQKVHLIDENGVNCGIVDTYIALNRALTNNLDLVEIDRKDNLSICKIINYGKYKYELSKNRKPQPKNLTKEVHLTPRIAKHDIEVHINKISKWINEGHKVIVSVHFKGRENSYKEIGYEVLKQFYVPEFNVSQIQSRPENTAIWIVITKP